MKLKNTVYLFVSLLLVVSLSACLPKKQTEDTTTQKTPPVQEGQPSQPQEAGNGYFTMEASKSRVSSGDEVEINIYLTTTGEEFDVATAIVKWDTNQFQFVKALDADLEGDEEALSTFVSGNSGKRILAQFVPNTEPPLLNMTTPSGQPTLFYTVTLKALQDGPARVHFSQDGENDESIHFASYGEQEVNSIDQSLSSKTEINF